MKIYFLIGQHFCETAFLQKVAKYLNAMPQLDDYTLFITNKIDELPGYGKKVIALITSDEEYFIPKYLNKVLLVFKNYVLDESIEHLIPLPLGYVNNFPDLPMKPILERETDVFFVGQKWGIDRITMANEIEKIKKNFHQLKFEVRLTEHFKTGLSTNEYANCLMNSKIALCPMGVKAPETFRFFEATKSGNVIISSLQPETYIYKNSPAIKIADWSKIYEVLLDIFVPEKLMALHNQTINFWNNFCSEKAVAEFILTKIKEIEK